MSPSDVSALIQVLVRVTHAGINGGCETFRTRAEFAFEANRLLRDFPLGAEGCGVVVAVGEMVTTVSVRATHLTGVRSVAARTAHSPTPAQRPLYQPSDCSRCPDVSQPTVNTADSP
jgi:NADPH:quinone reductase-like Zn-dependent oxidoreductase